MQPSRPTSVPAFRQPARRGASLVELMVVMTIMSAVLTVGLTGLVRLFRLQTSEVQALSEITVWRRLAQDFRADTHAAATATCTKPERLELSTASGLVVWSVDGDTLKRQLQPAVEGEAAADSVEHYRLPDAGFSLSLTPSADIPRTLASVIIKRPGSPHTRPTSGRIEAAVGLSLRHRQATTTGGAP